MDHLVYKLEIGPLHGAVLLTLFFLLCFFLVSMTYFRASAVYTTNSIYVLLFMFFYSARRNCNVNSGHFGGCVLPISEFVSPLVFFSIPGGADVSLILETSAGTAEFSMLLVLLALAINVYAAHYFKKDPEFGRFTLLLFFFCFFMLLMISATSWVFTFIAWEGVGLLSFLLVSFWYSKVNTFKSGIKVLAYNRLGDFFFFLSIGFILFFFKSDDILFTADAAADTLGGQLKWGSLVSLDGLVTFSLVLVILSKCAQFGFHIWLLEAMEAPLPASSLIHSATLVCVGVVLFFKTGLLIGGNQVVASLLVFWSALSAAALSWSALFNYDIKKILAYSTGSHVSIMLALGGCGDFGASFSYMLIHASSKVFIFLLFGFIIDINRGVRDLRKMGGFFFSGATLNYAVVGLFFLSSFPFFSLASLKDVLAVALLKGAYFLDLSLLLLMLATIGNYLYSIRLFLKIFFGDLLSFRGSYFTNFGVIGKTVWFYSNKKDSLGLALAVLQPLVVYIFFLEATLFFSGNLGFAHYFYENACHVYYLVPNGHMKYLAMSNLFIYLVFFLRLRFRLFR